MQAYEFNKIRKCKKEYEESKKLLSHENACKKTMYQVVFSLYYLHK